MKDGEIHIGDVLRIRQWDDMLQEFGSDICKDIDMPHADFVVKMRHLCGLVFTVKEIVKDRDFALDETYFNYYRSYEGIESNSGINGFWYITAEMLEPYDCKDDMEPPPTGTDGLFSFLGM